MGLGNSTRCYSVIQELLPIGAQITIASSGNGLKYFGSNLPEIELVEMRDFQYGKAENKLSFYKTFFSIPKYIFRSIQNQRIIWSLVKRKGISLIISDSDYNLFPLLLFLNIKIISINNSDYVLRSVFKNKGLPLAAFPQFLIEVCDYIYHQLFSDLIISPNFFPLNKSKKIKQVPLLVRKGLLDSSFKHNQMEKKVGIMLTGSGFCSDTTFLNKLPVDQGFKYIVLGREGKSNEHFNFLGKIMKNDEELNSCDLLIINAGFSAVSEAILLKKPCIVMPVQNHSEQFSNAQFVERNKFGLVANEDNLSQKFSELLNNIDFFRNSLELAHFNDQGAGLAAKLILDFHHDFLCR